MRQICYPTLNGCVVRGGRSDQAALLAIGISQAQAFIDGNKRTAFATLDAFLWVNEWEYVGEPLALAQQLEHLAERSADPPAATDAFEAWLRQNVQPGTSNE